MHEQCSLQWLAGACHGLVDLDILEGHLRHPGARPGVVRYGALLPGVDRLLVDHVTPLHRLKSPVNSGHHSVAFLPGGAAVLEDKLDGEQPRDRVLLIWSTLQRDDVTLTGSLHQLGHGH